MQPSLILWTAYLRMIWNFVKRGPKQVLLSLLAIFGFACFFLIPRGKYGEAGDVLRESLTFGLFAGAVLYPNKKFYDKDRPLLEVLQKKSVIKKLSLQKIALNTLLGLLMAKTFYYGQKLNWYVVIGVAASTLSFAFAFNRFKDGRKGSAPWAQGLRQAFVEIWPIADESKAYLRVQIFSHWTSYRSVFSILYFTLISFASISIIFLFRAQPGVGWQVFLPILTFYMILCMSPMDDVEGLPLLQSRWKSAVFHAEWIRWTAFWCLIYGLWILVLALTLPFRHPILAFALGAFLGLWITVWASYLRVRFSASTWQRCIYATLSLAIPLLIPIIVTTEKKE